MNTSKLIPTPEVFFTTTSLYEKYEVVGEQVFNLADILYVNVIDSYCIGCRRDATFKGTQSLPSEFDWNKRSIVKELKKTREQWKGFLPKIESRIYKVDLKCTRYGHVQNFFVLVESEFLQVQDIAAMETKVFVQKIGQFPSIGDISIPSLKKYASILGDERYREFSRAIGLASHDVGIGAYVYLRRIFESLIEDAHKDAKESSGWDEEQYNKCRMSEKVELLKQYLPEFLVQNSSIYSLLSKGIHELTEDDCLKHFHILKAGIELILDDIRVKKEREKKLKEVQSALGIAINKTSGP